MDTPDYPIATMRRGSYDDATASLRPVSIDPPKEKMKQMSVTQTAASCMCERSDCVHKTGVFGRFSIHPSSTT